MTNPILEEIDREISEREQQLDKLREARDTLADALEGVVSPPPALKTKRKRKARRDTPSRPSSKRSSGGDRSRGRKARGGGANGANGHGGSCERAGAGGCTGDLRTETCAECGEHWARCAQHSRGPGHPAKVLARHQRDAHA